MKNNNLIPITLFSIIAVIYTFPIFENIFYWGQMDWDQFTFWNAVPREAILRYHQFPLWNLYANGGNVLLAHPHSPFLSPMYLFVLILGPVLGLKIEIFVHLIVGLFGMFLLSKYRGLTIAASYLASFVFMLSAIYTLHLTEGHASWITMAFMPWVFLYYQKSIDDHKNALGVVIFLGLMLFAGSIDVFFISVAFLTIYSFFKLYQLRNPAPVILLFIIFVGTFLLCSVKLLPMIEYLIQFPRLTESSGGTSLAALYEILLGRGDIYYDILLGKGDMYPHEARYLQSERLALEFEWHEYGAYIGIIPFAMFLIGAVSAFKKHWPLIMTGLISLWIALGDWSYVNLWLFLHNNVPIFNSYQVPSRFILGFIFALSLLSGYGLEYIEQLFLKIKHGKAALVCKLFVIAIVSFVAFDLWQVNSPALLLTFRVPPIEEIEHARFAQRYDSINLSGKNNTRSSMYPIFLSNSGILNGYEVVNIKKGDVRIESHPEYRGEVYLLRSNKGVFIEYFSPNKIVVDFTVKNADILIVNQNYYTGWKVKKGLKTAQAEPYNGLISTQIEPGHYKITFYFMPFSFLIGLFITVSFILFGVVFYTRKSQKY